MWPLTRRVKSALGIGLVLLSCAVLLLYNLFQISGVTTSDDRAVFLDDPPLQYVQKPPKYFMVACAKVGAELPYIVEWLEYHRLQGFERFVLYVDDFATTPNGIQVKRQLDLLQEHYEEYLHEPTFLEVRTMGALAFDAVGDILSEDLYSYTTAGMHRLGQQSMAHHCFRQERGNTEWFMHFDIDEFLVVPGHEQNRTIRSYLAGLYQEEEAGPATYYQNAELAGLYLLSLNMGIGDAYVLRDTVEIARDAQSGQVKVYYNHEVPFVFPANQRASSNVHAVRNMVDYLIENINRSAHGVFEDIVNSMPRARLPDTSYPLIMQKQRYSVPSVLLDDPASMLSRHLKFRPECREAIEWLNNTAGLDLMRRRKKTLLARRVKGAGFSGRCVPGGFGTNKLTEMGKSLLWTGQRYYASTDADDDLLLKDILPYQRRRRRGQMHFGVSAPRAALQRLPQEKARTGERRVLEDPDAEPPIGKPSGVGSSGAGAGSSGAGAGSSGAGVGSSGAGAAGTARPETWSEDSRKHVSVVGGNGDASALADYRKPILCHVAWVHGCAHRAVGSIVGLNPKYAILHHYMFRSLEARTIGDAQWRAGTKGWGKLESSDPNDLRIIEYGIMVKRTNNTILSLLPRLKKAIHSRVPTQYRSVAYHANLTRYWK